MNDQGYIRGDSAGYLVLQGGSTATNFNNSSNGSTLMTILNGGNVGIGTTSPGAKLEVAGALRVATDANSILNILDVGTDAIGVYAAAGDEIYMGANNTWQLRFKSAGVDVSGAVDVTSNITVGGTVIHNNTSTRDKYRVYSSSDYAIGMQSGITYGGLSDWAMTFQFNNDNARGFWWGDTAHSTGQGAMSLTTNGYLTVANLIRVGYGESDTTDPTSTTRFDVAGSSGQLFSVVDSLTGTLMAVNDSSGMPIFEVTSSDEVIVTGQILCTGEITAYYSDERLKNRLGRINNALDAILSLNGFKYTANELAVQNGYKNSGVQLGLSAQEVQKVLPELVKLAAFDVAHDDDGNEFSKTGANYLTLDYTKLVPVLVEAIKEQQQRIEKLEKIILEKTEG